MCFTCGKRAYYKDGMQCGHYIQRGCLALRYDLRNTEIQCSGCNIFKKGNYPVFTVNLIAKHGPGIIETLYRESKKVTPIFPYEAEITKYKELLKEYDNI